MSIQSLQQLYSLIGESLKTLEGVFSDSQHTFPSLDEVYDPKDPSEALLLDPRVIEASNVIVSAAEQLTATVKLPYLSLCDAVMGYHLPASISFAEKANLVEILREAGEGGMHVDEIAAKAGTSVIKTGTILA